MKETTIYDIAQKLNISAATVSRALNDHPAISQKTKKLIIDTAREMGYRFNYFASNIRRQRTNTLGVIVPRLNSSFMSEVLAGMEKAANNANYNLIITQSLETEIKEKFNATTLFNSRVDGLLVSLAYDTQNYTHFQPFIDRNIPVIFFDRAVTLGQCTTITIDNFTAGYDIGKHLINEGCKNFMHVTGNLQRNVYSERYKGFHQALTDYHISFSETRLISTNLSPESGLTIARNILSMNELPDGIFIANDVCAASCIQELKRNGVKIPMDIAIAGFNNDIVSCLIEPPLTTIQYNGFEMGEIAIQSIITEIMRTTPINLKQTIVLEHEIIVRESSSKKNNNP